MTENQNENLNKDKISNFTISVDGAFVDYAKTTKKIIKPQKLITENNLYHILSSKFV